MHTVGRGISALMGVLSLVLVYEIGSRLGGPWAGALSALLLAFAPGHIQQSHYYTVDPALAFWSILGIYLALRMPSDRAWLYLAMGGVCGLAAGTRLVGIWLGVPFLLAHLWPSSGRIPWRNLLTLRVLLFFISAAIVALACEPFLVTDPGRYTETSGVRGFLPSIQIARGERIRVWTLFDFSTTPYLFYFTHLLKSALGTPLEIFACLGAILALWHRSRTAWLILAWVLPYFLMVGGLHTKPIRYAAPLLPALAILGAWSCVWMVERLRRRPPPIPALPVLVVLLPTGFLGVSTARIYALEDSRIVAARWVRDRIPEGTRVLAEHGGFPTAWMVPEGRYEFEESDTSYYIAAKDWILYRFRIEFMNKKLKSTDWIVLIEENRMRQFLAVPDRYPIAHTLYRRLNTGDLGFERVAEFKTHPGLWKWQLDETGAEPTITAFDHPRVVVFRRGAGTSPEEILEEWMEAVEKSPSLPDRYILDGVRAYHEEDWTEAEKRFGQALEIRPEFGLAHLLIGEVRRKLGDRKGMEAAWIRAIEARGPITMHAFLGIVEAGLAEEGLLYLELLALEKSRDPTLRKLIASLHFEQAVALHTDGRYSDAVRRYRKVLEFDPGNIPTHLNLGQCLISMGETDRAREVYGRALELDPGNQMALEGLAEVGRN